MKQLIMAAGLAVMLTACGTSEKKTVEGENPFFAEYTTPFGVPPFDQISRRSRIRLSLWMSRVRCFGRSRSFSVDRIA